MRKITAYELSDGRLFAEEDYEEAVSEQKKLDFDIALSKLIEVNGGYSDEKATIKSFFETMKEPLSDIFKQFT